MTNKVLSGELEEIAISGKTDIKNLSGNIIDLVVVKSGSDDVVFRLSPLGTSDSGTQIQLSAGEQLFGQVSGGGTSLGALLLITEGAG